MQEIHKRLNCVREDNRHWRTQLLKITQEMSKYEDLKRNRPGGNHETVLHRILPTYREVFNTHNIYQRKKNQLPSRGDNNNYLSCYDVGIFLVGFSTLPIALSLAEIQPLKQVYFLYSDDTVDMLDEINNRISAMLPQKSTLSDLVSKSVDQDSGFALKVRSPSDPIDTFKQIKTIIHEVEKNLGAKTDIALDLTGGKKTMIGGGFTAGSIYSISPKCDMFYVDSLEYDPGRGSPKPGYEFLSRLENPYNVYNVQSVHEAEKLFEKHNYEAAAGLWEIVGDNLNTYAEQYGLEKERDAIEKNLCMADCYSLWDAFDYVEAKESKVNDGNLWDYNTKHTYNLHALIDVLKILSEVEDQETLFAEDARIIHYAVDRYQNGIRRVDSDKFDDAIVRFTQVVEILCLYQIYRIAMNNSLTSPGHRTVSEADCLNETWSISKLIIFLFGQSWKYDNYCIANEDMKLNINDYGYTDAREITALIDARNKFVHVKSNPGWEEMKENAQNLQSLACKFLKNFSGNYCCQKGLPFDTLLELHRFCSVTQEK
ncbi:MAG: hypothetical protein OXN25_17335 [Candidatus Poribacteria bacterium]|nr:hypothetical protein [Candidatus Poribacteria bacterium]